MRGDGRRLQTAAENAFAHIAGTTGKGPAGIASWSLVHGLAMLMLDSQISIETTPGDMVLRATNVLWEGLQATLE